MRENDNNTPENHGRSGEENLETYDERRNDPIPDIRVTERVDLLPLEAIRLPRRDLRRHSKKQIGKLKKSIEVNGFITPIVVNGRNEIIAGVARYITAKELGLPHIPCIRVSHLSEEQLRAFRLFDNRIAEDASWDEDELARELMELSELGIDLAMTGLEIPEIDLVIETRLAKPHETARNELPELEKQAVTRPGDIWQLGNHFIACGDALDARLLTRLMNSSCVRVLFTDPPYNVAIDGHVSGLGKASHREFAMAAGEMSEEEFFDFLVGFLEASGEFLIDGALIYVFMDWRHLEPLLAAGRSQHFRLFNICVWAKTNAGMGSFYRSQHELVVVFKKGDAPHLNNIELGRHGRYRTNVWSYAGMNSFNADREEALRWHPTVKPVEMIADALLDCTAHGDIVLDPFLGSGSTLIAAEDVGRICYGVEIDPLYVDLAIRRWEDFTDGNAIHGETGLTFREMENRRDPSRLLPSPSANNRQED